MQSISFYFAKYKTLGVENESVKKIIAEILKKELDLDIDLKKIKIEKDRIVLGVSGPVKSQLFIKKTKINKIFIEKISEIGIKTSKKIT